MVGTRSRPSWFGVAAVLTLGGMGLVVPPASSARPAGIDACDGFEPGGLSGIISEPRVVELSGLAASRRHDDVLWGHNDSGGAPELYAMGEDGTALGAYPVDGATATDWEDMAAGPGPDGTGDLLYIGDIGDNDAERPSVTVYRVPEPEAPPTAPGATLEGAEAFDLTYPDGPSDAEALLVDPRSGDVVIVTKSVAGASQVLEAPRPLLADGQSQMVDRGGLSVPIAPSAGEGLPGTMVTGGDVSPDGSLVVLRTYRSVLVFERGDDQTLAEALLGEPCFGPQQEEQQGEAIAFTHDGSSYVTASEGTSVPISRIAVTEPIATTTTVPSTTSITPATGDDDTGDDSTILAVLVGAAILLVLLGGAAVYVARRRRASGAG